MLVDIGGVDARTIELADGRLVLSALIRHVELEHSELVAESVPDAGRGGARRSATSASATAGRSAARWHTASRRPSSPCVAIAHRAVVHVLGPDGGREVAVADLTWSSPMVTTLAPGELITRVEIPVLDPGQGSCFFELARRAG